MQKYDVSMDDQGEERTPRLLPWSPQDGTSGVEVLDRVALFERIPPSLLAQPERLDFHLLIVCHGGQGKHTVDGITVALSRGTVLHVQPGQIHQWSALATYGAWLVLAQRLPSGTSPHALGPRRRQLSEQHLTRVRPLLEFARHPPVPPKAPATQARALGDLLAINLELTAPDLPLQGPYAKVYGAFQRDLAAHPDVRDSVLVRARRLGYSARTLSRACQAMAKRTAKQHADWYLAAEARRLLAAPGASVTAVGATLGFGEPTNFAKFVRRVTGRVPSAWQRAEHGER